MNKLQLSGLFLFGFLTIGAVIYKVITMIF